MYFFHTSSVTLPLIATQWPRPQWCWPNTTSEAPRDTRSPKPYGLPGFAFYTTYTSITGEVLTDPRWGASQQHTEAVEAVNSPLCRSPLGADLFTVVLSLPEVALRASGHKRYEISMAEKDHANVLIPPPLALAVCVVAAWLIDRVWPVPFLPLGLPRWLIGGALIAAGLATEAWSLLVFRRARTSVLPMRSTSAIVEAGPYRYSRNPIYLAMFLTVAGFAVALDSLWQFAALIALYVVLRWAVVAREEAYLTRKFGATYLEYARRVRRWI